MRRKTNKNGFEEYRTTLILLTILMAVMSLIIFMPLKHSKQADVSTATVGTR
ncbi:MAG TPA: hypothetical protein VGN20_11925 [Mucilaginibacter sp.]|jgi:preprotein translocase subunit SecG